MTVAHDNFRLKPVMQRVWGNHLEDGEKEVLSKHFGDIDEDDGPSEERHLMVAQVAVMMPELISQESTSHATQLGDWFSQPSEQDALKSALNKYTYLIAKDLFSNSFKDSDFGTPRENWENSQAYKSLEDFLAGEGCPHIATLNYDGFLYPLVVEAAVKGNDRKSKYRYTDGFKGKPPQWKNCFVEDAARYLHLHGSPLFWGEPWPQKLSAIKVENAATPESCPNHIKFKNLPDFAPHIILSDGVLKPLLIARSKILSKYWEELQDILLNGKPEEILLFGYGGGDDHLNRLIGKSGCPVRVVEWCDDHSIPDREQDWKKRLGDDTDVIVDLRKKILTFDEWAARPAESKMEDDA